MQSLSASCFGLAAVLAFAGIVHLALAPEHLAESTLVGVGFVGFGIAQAGLAAWVLISPSRVAARLSWLISVASLVPLGAALTVGMPSMPSGESMGLIGPVEALDDLAALTGLSEIVAVGLAVRLVRGGGGLEVGQVARARRRTSRSEPSGRWQSDVRRQLSRR